MSACLLGERVRWDGGAKPVQHPVLSRWLAEGRVVPFCPELEGGLAVPRPPAEQQPSGRVVARDGADVTAAFERGARGALAAARREGAVLAVLKDESPSCGSTRVHDGSFSGRLVAGAGVTAQRLRAAGLEVFDETQWDAAQAALGG